MAERALATAYVTIVPSMKGFSSKLRDEINPAASAAGEDGGAELGRSTAAGFKKNFVLGGIIAGAVASATTMAVSSIQQLAGEAVKASDATDKFKQTLNFAGIDSGTISSLTKQTRAYADQTVYDLATIQSTTAQLAANGVPNYGKLTEAAGNLNAVAGGNAETFKSVAMVLTQTAGAGKLTTENWNQLSNAIPGASGKLQEALLKAGAYTGNFRDAMEKGQISSEEFNKALMELGNQPVAVEAAKSTTTFEGAIGNLQATIVGGLSDALNSIKPLATDAISGLAGVFTWLGGAFTGIISLLGSGDFTAALGQAFGVNEDSPVIGLILNIRQAVIDMAGFVVGALGGLFSWIGANMGWIAPVVAAVLGAVTAFKLWMGAIALWQGIVKIGIAIQMLWNAVLAANPIMLVIMAIAALVAGLVWFFTMTEVGQQAWQAMVDGISAAINWLWTTIIQPVFAAIGAIFAWLWETIIRPYVQFVVAYFIILGAIFTWLYENIVKPVFGFIGAIFTWLWENIIKPFVDSVVASFQFWGSVFAWLYENIIRPVFTAIGAIFNWVWSNIIKPVIDWIVGAIQGIGETAGKIFGGLGDLVKNAFDGLIGIIRGPVNAIIDLMNGLIDHLNSIKIDIPEWARDLFGGATQLGFNIPHIPKLAKGGYVTQPTTALIGEAGPEVVTPLKDFERMMGISGGGNGQTVIYNAAPNQSIDAEQALFTALERAKVLASW